MHRKGAIEVSVRDMASAPPPPQGSSPQEKGVPLQSFDLFISRLSVGSATF